jgi:hypothetical protein
MRCFLQIILPQKSYGHLCRVRSRFIDMNIQHAIVHSDLSLALFCQAWQYFDDVVSRVEFALLSKDWSHANRWDFTLLLMSHSLIEWLVVLCQEPLRCTGPRSGHSPCGDKTMTHLNWLTFNVDRDIV